jgi:hypothetical protein
VNHRTATTRRRCAHQCSIRWVEGSWRLDQAETKAERTLPRGCPAIATAPCRGVRQTRAPGMLPGRRGRTLYSVAVQVG